MRRVFKMLEEMKLAKQITPDVYSIQRKAFRDIRKAFEKRLEQAEKRLSKKKASARAGNRKAQSDLPLVFPGDSKKA
jgi:hypothetical protein